MYCTVLQCPRMASGRRWTVAVLVGRMGQWTGGLVNRTTARVTGSHGEEISQRGWADGVLNESASRQVDGCHPHFATASKQVASPSSSSPQGSPSHGTTSPWVPSHHIYTVHTLVLTHRYAHPPVVLILHNAQSTPAPGDWARKHSLSRLNPGVSFPLRPSSHSYIMDHYCDALVIKTSSQYLFSFSKYYRNQDA